MDLPVAVLRPFIGARVIKTGLAVFVALVAFHFIGPSYATFAAVAAILAIQPAVTQARQVLQQQLIANLVGGMVGAALGYWFGPSALAMALGVILVLGLCSRLQLGEAASLAVVVVLFVMDRPEQDFLLYTAARLAAISGGMLIGYTVNRFLLPPNYGARLSEELLAASLGMAELGHRLIAHLAAPELLTKEQVKEQVAKIQQRLDKAGYYLDLSHDAFPEQHYLVHLEKLRSSGLVMVQRMLDIHRTLLEEGGLGAQESKDALADALRHTLTYEQDLLRRCREEGARQPGQQSARQPGPDPGQAAHAALERLHLLVLRLVSEEGGRGDGLVLHSLLTNLRHIGWRLDALDLLVENRP